jgi:hypothetical protein
MKLGIATITYNEKIGLQRLIESIDYNYVDIHFIEDGKFPNHVGKYDYSDDGTHEIINNDKILFEVIAEDESIKRQRYLTLCEEHNIDALIILDSDEYVDREHTDWPKFRLEISKVIWEQEGAPYIQNVYSLDNFNFGAIQERPRLWIYPSQMEYVNGSHKVFKNKFHNFNLDPNGRQYAVPRKKKWFSFRFLNDNSFRIKMRRKAHDEYTNWLIQHEDDIKKGRIKK